MLSFFVTICQFWNNGVRSGYCSSTQCKVMYIGKSTDTDSHYYLIDNELKWGDQCGKSAGKAMAFSV